jgi:hypothetical protein
MKPGYFTALTHWSASVRGHAGSGLIFIIGLLAVIFTQAFEFKQTIF